MPAHLTYPFFLEELTPPDNPFSNVEGMATGVLTCFGFFISLLDFFWPLAMMSFHCHAAAWRPRVCPIVYGFEPVSTSPLSPRRPASDPALICGSEGPLGARNRASKALLSEERLWSSDVTPDHIMPSIPPMPPMPPPMPALAVLFGSGLSAIMASVVINRPATEAASCSA